MYPTREWPKVLSTARMKGLSNNSRSFLFRLVHNLHPTKSRLHRLNPRAVPSPFCSFCLDGEEKEEEDNISHIYSSCSHSFEAMNWLKAVLEKFDPYISAEKIVTLQIDPENNDCIFECIFLTAETLEYIWDKRLTNKQIEVERLKSTIRAKINLLKRSKFKNHGTNLLTMMDIIDLPPAGVLPDAPLA